METIQLTTALSDAGIEELEGRKRGPELFDLCVRDTTRLLKPDGSPLLIYVKDALPRSLCALAFEAFKKVDFSMGANRGMASGLLEEHPDWSETEPSSGGAVVRGGSKATRYHPEKLDGTISNSPRAVAVSTAIVGYFDRTPRTPYCRQTVFTARNPEQWANMVPYIQRVSRIFQQYAPEQFAAQEAFVRDHVHPDFVIPESIFTTVTVNRDWQTAFHRDAGDFRSGLGVMTALEGGIYRGCELIFPKYRVAVDMRTAGVCLADVHELHGNAPLIGEPGQYARISAVFYAREGMAQCGSRDFELERAKQQGEKIAVRKGTVQGKLF